MADELGAVRRTSRPTGDRQTPETGPQESAGTTNTPSPVSGDHPGVREDGTGDLRAEVSGIAEALANLRGRMMATAVIGGPDVTDDTLEAFAALPDCTACGGTGKDDHATVFEASLAVHFAAPEIEIAGRRRQLCLWCGHVLLDVPLANAPKPWPPASLVRIEDGMPTIEPYEPGDPLPPGCCALPDDEDAPGTCPTPCDDDCTADCHEGHHVPWKRQHEPEHCGKHTGNCSNRCLLPANHDGECDDDPRRGEAQETRATDWPAEDGDRG